MRETQRTGTIADEHMMKSVIGCKGNEGRAICFLEGICSIVVKHGSPPRMCRYFEYTPTLWHVELLMQKYEPLDLIIHPQRYRRGDK